MPRLSSLGSTIIVLALISISVARAQHAAPIMPAAITLIENRGQVVDERGAARPDILFTGGSDALRFYLRRDGISYLFSRTATPARAKRSSRAGQSAPAPQVDRYRMDMELIGANTNAAIVPDEIASAYTNYYLPQCPKGITHVAGYHRVTYRDIYPHIDLVIQSDGSHIKYSFVVHPGGDAARIRWRYVGASAVRGDDGSLAIRNPLGQLDEGKPVAYQNGGEVRCAYSINGGVLGFTCDRFDMARDLVIDPTVAWASYWGGAGFEQPSMGSYSITANTAGDICAVGTSESLNFPVTAGAMQSTLNGSCNIVISKISRTGTIVWSTYWGGSSTDYGRAIAFDNAGNVAVAGSVWSGDIPITTPAFQGAHSIGAGNDGVVGVLDGAGTLKWATFIGGSADENVRCIAADSSRNVIIGGEASGGGYPTRSAMQPTFRGGTDGFISKFDTAGTLLWSSYYGGTGSDAINGVATDLNGDVVLCGSTSSTNLTLAGTPFKSTGGGGDAFLMRLTPAGTPLWATYYGGSNNTGGQCVAIDPTGAAILVGGTDARDLPTTPLSMQPASPGGDGYVTKFDAFGVHQWSTYYGGSDNVDYAVSVTLADADIIVAGTAKATNLPTTPGTFQATKHGQQDAYLIEIDPAGGQLKYGTYYGGSVFESGLSVAFGAGSAYLLGSTSSSDLPTVSAFQPAYGGSGDFFIARISGFCPEAKASIDLAGNVVLCEGDSLTLTAAPGFTNYHWAPTNQTSQKIVVKTTGSYTVTAQDGSNCVTTSRATIVKVNKKPVPAIAPSGTISICFGDSVLLTAKRTGFVKYAWSNGDSLEAIWVKLPGTYSVRVIDTNGCSGTSVGVTVTVKARPAAPVLAAADTIWICGDSVLTLDAGVAAGYTWAPAGETTRTIKVKNPGLYYVDVSNASGCRNRSDSVVVMHYPSVPALLIVDGASTLCSGDSVILRKPAGAFSSPRWSNGSRNDSLVVRASGSYYLTVIDSNGCRERSDTVRITVQPPVRADIGGPARVCRDALATYATTSAGNVRYAWSLAGDGTLVGAADGKSISVQWGASGSGTITLRVTDTVTGCSATGVQVVTVGTSLQPVIVPAGPITICEGDSVELDAGAGYATYAWSNGATTQTIWIKDSAAYSVAVHDASGCSGVSDTVRATIEAKPEPIINGPIKVCRSSIAIYNASGASDWSYTWQVTGGSITGGDGTPSITVAWGSALVGQVDLTATSTHGCVGTMSLPVEVGSSLTPIITPGGTLALCSGDSIELDGGTGYATYRWSTGDTTERIVVRAAGAYAVSVIDAGGCSGTSDSVHVRQGAAPTPSILPAGPITLQAGDSVRLDAGSGYAVYRWKRDGANAGGTQFLTARDSGSYVVTVIDTNGCSGTDSVRVDLSGAGNAVLAIEDISAAPGERVDLPLRLVSSTNLAGAGIASFEAEVRYRASALVPDGTTMRGTIDGDDRVITVSGALPAAFTSGELARIGFIAALGDSEKIALQLTKLTWRDARGVERPVATTLRGGSFTLTGLCTNGGTRLVQAGSAGLKAITPNPADDQLRIDYDLLVDCHARITVTDMLGRELIHLLDSDQSHGSHTVTCDASRLSSGIYVIVLETPDGHGSGVVMIER